jgi:hypothetical protein
MQIAFIYLFTDCDLDYNTIVFTISEGIKAKLSELGCIYSNSSCFIVMLYLPCDFVNLAVACNNYRVPMNN